MANPSARFSRKFLLTASGLGCNELTLNLPSNIDIGPKYEMALISANIPGFKLKRFHEFYIECSTFSMENHLYYHSGKWSSVEDNVLDFNGKAQYVPITQANATINKIELKIKNLSNNNLVSSAATDGSCFIVVHIRHKEDQLQNEFIEAVKDAAVNIKSATDLVKTAVDAATSKLGDVETECQNVKSAVDSAKAAVDLTKGAVDSCTAGVALVKTATDSVKTSVDAVNTSAQAIKSSTDLVKAACNDIETEVAAFKTANAASHVALKSSTDSIKTACNDIETEVAAFKTANASAHTALKAEVTAFKTANASAHTALKAEVTAFKSANASNIGTLDTSIQAVKTAADSIKSAVDLHKAESVAIKNKIRYQLVG